MAITTYSELLTAVNSHLDRSDISSFIPDFVVFFESLVNYGDDEMSFDGLRVRDMVITSSSNTPDASGDITLATDFLAMDRRVVYQDAHPRGLNFMTAVQMEADYPTTDTGATAFYTIVGNVLRIRPNGTSLVDYDYFQSIPALVTNSTNWLLTKSPQAYLYGTLYFTQIFLENPDGAVGMFKLMRSALGGIRAADKVLTHGSLRPQGYGAPSW